ncbi:MAG: UDP-N-acetylglucosamine 1-carboxyvinyltransferase [Patescibacteria group bacterium]
MKDIFLIKGQHGKRALVGELPVFGAKNAVLPAFASAILFDEPILFENVPFIQDVQSSVEIIKNLGGKIERKGYHEWRIDASVLTSKILDHELSKKMRASTVFIGPLLARYGEVVLPHPGGCVLGERPVDMFISAFEKMGATVTFDSEIYTFKTNGKKLHGAEIFLRVPSHTVTETVMMAATLAEGTTVIKNAAMEPEIGNVAEFLISCGAKITGVGSPTLTIVGGGILKAGKKSFKTIPDRIEAGSFLILAALAGEDITIKNCNPMHLESLIATFERSGLHMNITKDSIHVKYSRDAKNSNFHGTSVTTHEYPGFPTDLQAPLTVFLTQVTGESSVFETIFDGRLNYADDLVKMGAKLNVWSKHTMTIKGPAILKGRELDGPDIRAGLAYILAAIVAKGRSVINNVHYVDRGYERIEERLKAVGVDIERVSN